MLLLVKSYHRPAYHRISEIMENKKSNCFSPENETNERRKFDGKGGTFVSVR